MHTGTLVLSKNGSSHQSMQDFIDILLIMRELMFHLLQTIFIVALENIKYVCV